jgi:transcriptional regulator with GAF, ATPase, and Fis domain
MRAVQATVRSVADTDATVLICGETGVGKDLVARTIHQVSGRAHGPFVKVNCAAIPDQLLESELFGHERGAFTGAHRRRLGRFEYAHHGTLYLDEVADLPLGLQAKLLHVLQDRSVARVGGGEPVPVDVRVVAATNRDLQAALARGDFRADLYYRLNVVEISVPPLRERREEIPDLVAHFLARFNEQYGRQRELSPETLAKLVGRSWMGNVRELENAVRRLVVLDREHDGIERPVPDAGEARAGTPGPGPGESQSLREIARRGARAAERAALVGALERAHWDRVAAARILRVSYKTLLNKISEWGLGPGPGRAPQR